MESKSDLCARAAWFDLGAIGRSVAIEEGMDAYSVCMRRLRSSVYPSPWRRALFLHCDLSHQLEECTMLRKIHFAFGSRFR
jgi:hypothetical protein